MAIRAALGAGAGQLARLIVVENLIVAVTGGALGAVLTWLSQPALSRMAVMEMPRLESFQVSAAALWFGAGATVICAILFALPAIWQSRRPDVQATIRRSGGITLSQRRGWFGSGIIAAEVALAFVVLTGAGLLYRSFATLLREPGRLRCTGCARGRGSAGARLGEIRDQV